ncbi:hypothetical protein SAMN02745196_02750 [Clostridium collagenovorans DSM 3089]|uniref:Uncharacterized protein n=1 Tax=Clostridium collagenovorans DSM 3089 TaxID=1121306 RepID=A0A1M5Y9D9_9CLOT|nr:hypothetical protein [Clostridium collagenovorans]SHI08566.1 hypothetical protein SAMN02745196_02750 [Clostridium collagenovorans DSM 3089]
MKKILSCIIITSMVCTMSPKLTVNAETIDTNDKYIVQTREFNQWDRSFVDFTFDVSSRKMTEKLVTSAVIQAAGTGIGYLGGPGTGIAGSAVAAAISSYATDCIENNYNKFGLTGYGTVIVGRYKSKLVVGVYFYSDSGRRNLVYSNTYKSTGFPV